MRRLCLVLSLAVAACSGSSAGGGRSEGDSGAPDDAVIPVSPDPDEVAAAETAIVGKVFDFVTGSPIGDAFVSTFPPTTTLRANGLGEFVLTEDLVPGQVFEVQGEANGYERRFVPARPVPGGRVTVNLPLVPSDQAIPLRFEPAVLVFTSDLQEVRVLVTNVGEAELNLSFEMPPWLSLPRAPPPLTGGGRETLTFRLSPEAFAEAVAELTRGASLAAEVRVTDQFPRFGLLAVVAVPAPPGLVTLEATTPAPLVLTVGSTVEVALTARYGQRPLLGATVRSAVEGDGLTMETPERVTGEDGVAVVRLRGERVGQGLVEARLPAYPDDVPPVRLAVEVRALDGPVPVGSCALDNGGCGDPLRWRCELDPASGPRCVDVDECAADNGGCGDPWHHRCQNVEGAPPVCVQYDPCAPDASGEHACGSPLRASCVDHAGAMPTCVDVDECRPGPDGRNECGVATRWTCTNRDRAAPECVPVDACATNHGNCGPPDRFQCFDRLDDDPDCIDIDECAVDNGGCGPRELHACVNVRGGPPICTARDLCAPDAAGANFCGEARFTVCEGEPGTYPRCSDRRECALQAGGRNGCPGPAKDFLCLERDGAAPECVRCPDGRSNLDADAASCEYACVASGEEVCDGDDDDCDGTADEAFDLQRDPQHCGVCDQSCTEGDHVAGAVCELGRCGALRCAAGFYDGDGDAANGCETALPDDVLFVDGDRADPLGDGTAAHPFATIAEALERADGVPDRVIMVAAGTYGECVSIGTSGTRLLGAGADRTSIICDAQTAVTVAAADDVQVQGVRIVTRTSYYGLFANAASGLVVTDVTVVGFAESIVIGNSVDVRLRGIRLIDVGGDASGGRALQLIAVDDATVTGLEVTNVRGAFAFGSVGVEIAGSCRRVALAGARIEDVASEPSGLGAVGVRIAPGAREVRLEDVSVARVAAGDALPGGAHPGADAVGILVGAGSELVVLSRVSVTDVRGGRGAGTPGGAAWGVDIEPSNAVDLFEVDVRDVQGGAGDGGPSGAAGGMRMVEVNGTRMGNLLVWAVRAPVPNAGVHGLQFDALVEPALSHVTVAEIGAEDETDAVGLFVGADQELPMALEDSLVSGVRGVCVRQTAPRAVLTVNAALLHDCGDPPIEGPHAAPRPPLTDDPRFRDRAAGDLRLAGDSPAVDAASPATAFEREPAPNGGRADLGRYGNTEEATPSP